MAALFIGSGNYASDDVRGGEGPQDESVEEGELNRAVSTFDQIYAPK